METSPAASVRCPDCGAHVDLRGARPGDRRVCERCQREIVAGAADEAGAAGRAGGDRPSAHAGGLDPASAVDPFGDTVHATPPPTNPGESPTVMPPASDLAALAPGGRAAPPAPPATAVTRDLPPRPEPALTSGTFGSLEPGRVLAKCRIESKIGRGGMGTVYLARHTILEVPVAIKVLSPELAEEAPSLAERFIREAQLAARLRHPNIVAVMDAGSERGLYYIVQEYVAGGSVERRLGEGPVSPTEAALVTADIAEALSLAHQHGIVHRDIKPANILLTEEGVAKLADLGLAKEAESAGGLTQSSTAMGTPAYMSPEQAEDARSADIRSDIYGLGASLYHMLVGRPPFEGETVFNILRKLAMEMPADPRAARPDLPPALAELCMAMLAKDPAARPATPLEVAAALRPWCPARPTSSRRLPAPEAPTLAPPSPPPAAKGAEAKGRRGGGGQPFATPRTPGIRNLAGLPWLRSGLHIQQWVREHWTMTAPAATLMLAVLIGILVTRGEESRPNLDGARPMAARPTPSTARMDESGGAPVVVAEAEVATEMEAEGGEHPAALAAIAQDGAPPEHADPSTSTNPRLDPGAAPGLADDRAYAVRPTPSEPDPRTEGMGAKALPVTSVGPDLPGARPERLTEEMAPPELTPKDLPELASGKPSHGPTATGGTALAPGAAATTTPARPSHAQASHGVAIQGKRASTDVPPARSRPAFAAHGAARSSAQGGAGPSPTGQARTSAAAGAPKPGARAKGASSPAGETDPGENAASVAGGPTRSVARARADASSLEKTVEGTAAIAIPGLDAAPPALEDLQALPGVNAPPPSARPTSPPTPSPPGTMEPPRPTATEPAGSSTGPGRPAANSASSAATATATAPSPSSAQALSTADRRAADALFERAEEARRRRTLLPHKRKALYEEANRLYRELVEQYPQSDKVEHALYWSGEIEESILIRNHRVAIDQYVKLLARFPRTRYPVRYRIGVLSEQIGDLRAARQWYERAGEACLDEVIREKSQRLAEELRERGY